MRTFALILQMIFTLAQGALALICAWNVIIRDVQWATFCALAILIFMKADEAVERTKC